MGELGGHANIKSERREDRIKNKVTRERKRKKG